MKRTVCLAVALATVAAVLLVFRAPAGAAVKSEQKILGEPSEAQALLYLIREKRFQGSARTMFVYADKTHLGTLDNNCYTWAYLDPGEHLLWSNWFGLIDTVELEAGAVYYFRTWQGFEKLNEEWGKALIEEVNFYCTPKQEEIQTAQRKIDKLYPKATKAASKKKDFVGTRSKREEHVAKWTKIDLTPYRVLCIDDFQMTDPKAPTRKNKFQVESVPQRLADAVAERLSPEFFEEILRGPMAEPPEGTVVLRAKITQYKPGSRMARSMFTGAGSAHLDLTAYLIDAATGEELTSFATKRTWAWGGVRGELFGIEQLEQNLAYELALYLEKCKG